jgi:VWFA-related protein
MKRGHKTFLRISPRRGFGKEVLSLNYRQLPFFHPDYYHRNIMGKRVGLGCLALLVAVGGLAQIRHDVAVVNIAVPVRVFDGTRFVGSLGIGDFEVTEDGRAQPIEAVYLIRGSKIQRQQGAADLGAPTPKTVRNYVLLFQIAEYMPEIDKAVDLFFEKIYRPGDIVDVLTPRRALRLREPIRSPAMLGKAQREVRTKLRTDILNVMGASRSLIDDMLTHLGESDSVDAALDLEKYRTDLERFKSLRSIDAGLMAAFAADLKARPGAKHVFIFYQRDKVPQLDNRKLTESLASNDYAEAFMVHELMTIYNRGSDIDSREIEQAFSDASVDIHFLYVTRNRYDPRNDVGTMAVLDGIQMTESSADIYRVFKEIAEATGGTSAASANPSALLRAAAEASEQYYLLYYRPLAAQSDGKFHRIDVKVMRAGLKVSHRHGYFARDTAAPAGTSSPEPAPALALPVEEIDAASLASPAPVKGGPVPAGLLKAAAEYCRNLGDASLFFVCREKVREELSGILAGQATGNVGPAHDATRVVPDKVRDWTYDYQLVRREGQAAETRTLLEEDGKSRHEENATLRTARFEHKLVVFGPSGLFSDDAQRVHEYRLAGETGQEGEPVVIIDVRPKGTDASSLYGKAWIRERDGAVLKIEWEPASMGNYAAIEAFARAQRLEPKIKFVSEYAFEKNGLRFPSSYQVLETYVKAGRSIFVSRTKVAYKNYQFFEVRVRTDIKRAGLDERPMARTGPCESSELETSFPEWEP